MILDKVIEYWQKEHPQEWEEYIKAFNEYWTTLHKAVIDGETLATPYEPVFDDTERTEYGDIKGAHLPPYFKKHEFMQSVPLTNVSHNVNGVHITADEFLDERYIDSFKEDPERIYKDITDIVEALEKSDFLHDLEIKNFIYAERSIDYILNANKARAENVTPEWNRPRSDRFQENYTTCYDFIWSILSAQRQAVNKHIGKKGTARVKEIIDAKAREWYPETAPARQDQPDATTHAIIKHVDKLEQPLDKVNGHIWNLLKEDTRGQIAIDFNMLQPEQSHLKAFTAYSINFAELDKLGDNVKISKKLTPFDKRVYMAVSALFNAGNEVITLTQIHYAMGNTKRPSKAQLEKINGAVEKMRRSYITIDNERETEVLKNYTHFKYNGYLMPIESLTAVVNGRVADSAIRIFREPPLMTFAKGRNQVTTIPIELLQSPVSKTEQNISIDDYLLERISREKRKGVKECRLLYATIYKHVGIDGTTGKEKKQRQRAPETIDRYLGYYKQKEFIKDYTAQPDGVTIQF